MRALRGFALAAALAGWLSCAAGRTQQSSSSDAEEASANVTQGAANSGAEGSASSATASAEESSAQDAASLESELKNLQNQLDTEMQEFQRRLDEQRERIRSLEQQLSKSTGQPQNTTASVTAPSTATAAVSPSAGQTKTTPAIPSTGNNAAVAAAGVVPAIAPFRPLPVGGATRGALKPAFEVGSVRVTPLVALKATFVHDSSSPGGDDFPLPGFLQDSGPTQAPEFHVKTRSSRFGANFEWLDRSERLTITGRFEFDWEGNFSRADNRNLSAIRSNMPSLRVAYGRIDYKLDANDTLSGVFGQDWTIFGSSTLPPLLETTGFGIGYGGLWEREPQMRFGWTHNFGWFQLMPEVAVAMPGSGDTPAAASIVNQLGYGERQGPDSDQPEWQSRIVFQWQLDHARGVAPAQIIFSAEHGGREAIVLGSAVPTTFVSAFRTGATVSSKNDGWTGEWQLPTRFATLLGKYYDGSDLRWFFGGQLFSNYNDTAGLTNTASALSTDGGSTVIFGLRNGVPMVAPQRPVRAAGGFVSIGLPLSRLAGADPEGRNMGWSMNFIYGTDEAKTRDLLRAAPAGSRARSDMSVGNIQYKLNNWVTFAFEQSLYRTRADTGATGLPLFMGCRSTNGKISARKAALFFRSEDYSETRDRFVAKS
ncbi:MAG TPA: hypothetical protein VG322_06920 [Candidatus Acidoferrales bacterium]|jgi:hypothetical protein|nr:hypothetical protein [Candidatus Acidoferrales bacterium]